MLPRLETDCPQPSILLIRRAEQTSLAAGIITVGIGIVVLAGWAFHVTALTGVLPEWPAMSLPTAFAFTLCGLALVVIPTVSPGSSLLATRRRVAGIAAILVILIGLTRLMDAALGWQISPLAGMAPATAFNFVVLGGALLCRHGARRFAWFQSLALFGVLIGWLGFSRYLYGGEPLLPYGRMAIHTAALFMIVAVGTLCTRADRGLIALVCSGTLDGTMLRRLLPPALILPFIFGWFRLKAQRAGWLGTEAGVSVFALANVTIFCSLLWATAIVLRRNETERQRVEQALRVNEEFTRLIVDTALDAVIIIDRGGVITGWNPQAEIIFGWPRHEAIGRVLAEIIIPEHFREAHRRGMQRYLATGEGAVLNKRIELSALRRDGREFPIELAITPLRMDENVRFSAFVRDVTERVKAQEALTVSERQYRLIFEQSPLPKWIFDTETLRFLAVNKAAQAHYGFSEAEFLAMTIRDIRPPEDIPALNVDVAHADGAQSNSSEWRHRLKDGTIIDVIVSAHDIEMGGRSARLVVIQDITERKRAEAKVQAQVARLDLLHQITRAIGERQDLESIFQVVVRSLEDNLAIDLCCMCLYDPLDEKLTVTRVGMHSGALAAELQLTEQAKIPIDQNGLSRCVRGQLVYEPDIADIRFPFPSRLARAGLRALVVAPLLVESKVFGVFVGARRTPNSFSSGECEFLKQLSEHTALAANQAELYGALQCAYEDLRQTQQAIMQQERLRALGQMASGIAHDINNAISPATLYLESLLEKDQSLGGRAREQLGIVKRALEDVAQTVSRMREFYRQRESQLTLATVDLNLLVLQVTELTRARWHDMPQQRGIVITLVTELAPNLPTVSGVESELREALINLVFNAVDAMSEGGQLIVRTCLTGATHQLGASPQVCLEVIDTGVGMDADTRRRCLEPFFTTKGERGTGLGLAMVYGTVQRHNADIQIESALGHGTTVRLSFAVPATTATTSDQAPGLSGPSARLRLLIIDDDPMVIKSLRDTLEADGHIVVTAGDGRDGIAAFHAAQARKELFAAVITDLGMPYVDGRKVANEIKAASPNTPVVLLTGWGQRLVADGETPANVDQVLAKPPKLRELRQTLARYCPSQPS